MAEPLPSISAAQSTSRTGEKSTLSYVTAKVQGLLAVLCLEIVS